jgi:hypothetical protein
VSAPSLQPRISRWLGGLPGHGAFIPALLTVALAGGCSDAPVTDKTGLGGGLDAGGIVSSAIDAPGAAPGASEVGPVALDAACVTQSARAQQVPLDLYFMLDASYSMAEDTALGMTKWEAIKAAIGGFLMDPQSAGLGVGLQLFPLVRSQVPEDCFNDVACTNFGPCLLARACSPATSLQLCKRDSDCGTARTCVPLGTCSLSDKDCLQPGFYCGAGPTGTPEGNVCSQIPGYCQGRDLCESTMYANPTVPITALPNGTASVMGSLAARKPEGLTPTAPALAGAIEHARARMKVNPARKVAVVLASDGFPSACMPNTIEAVADLARAGADGVPAVATFAIGVVSPSEKDSATANLGSVAIAGGTTRAFVINTAADVTHDFQDALTAIRSSALACEFKLPNPPVGTLDYTRVNVQLTRGDGSAETIPNVANKAACDPARGGWYYDVDASGGGQPTTIVTCGATCDRLRAEVRGQVDIVLGCRTVVD